MGGFFIDKQTIEDLQLLPNGGRNVFECFDKTITKGGGETLRLIFKNPVVNLLEIKNRIKLIEFFMSGFHDLNLDRNSVDFMEFYLRQSNKTGQPSLFLLIMLNAIKNFFAPKQAHYIRSKGILNSLENLRILKKTCEAMGTERLRSLSKNPIEALQDLMCEPLLERCLNDSKNVLKWYEIEKMDFLLRNVYQNEVFSLLEFLYLIDAYQSVALCSNNLGFTFADYLDSEPGEITLEELFHPLIPNPVKNGVVIDSSKHILFVTGANMSGKSTLMKSVGIAVYLAHLGFPVPASKMTTSILDGLITTINVSDSLDSGNSHFYSEVCRVKLVAEKLNESKAILAIFDELFRGTNVIDAFEGSLKIIRAFAMWRTSFFLISTHIVEVANNLATLKNIEFKYFDILIKDNVPNFSYKLKDGVSSDRIGLWILENEGIFDLLNAVEKKIPQTFRG